MKNERIIALLEALKAENAAQTYGSFVELDNVLEALRAEVRAANNKKSGALNTAKVAEKIAKSAAASKRFAWAGLVKGSDNSAYVCDGMRALKIHIPVEVPEVPEKHRNPDTVHTLEKLFGSNAPTVPVSFQLPSAADLKSQIALMKSEKKIHGCKTDKIAYHFAGGPLVNAEYLLEMITATGAERVTTQKSEKWNACLLFIAEAADGILCPIYQQPGQTFPENNCCLVH